MKNKKLNKINVVILLILFSLFPFVGCQQEELTEITRSKLDFD